MAGNGQKWRKLLEIGGNSWMQGQKQPEMAGMDRNCWKWLAMAEFAWNSWKWPAWLVMDGSGWNCQEMLEIADNSLKGKRREMEGNTWK